MTDSISPIAAVKLLPCPFCGSDAHAAEHDANNWMVYCVTCAGAIDPEFKSEADAITAWNRRASIEQPTSEAVAWIDQFGNVFPLGAYSPTGEQNWFDADKRGWKPLYRAAPSGTPPAKEAILQAMVDQAQELGLYDVETASTEASTVRNTALDEAADKLVDQQKYSAAEIVRDLKSVAGAPVDERAAMIRAALDIALDLANAEAADIHVRYKGYKPHAHAAADADVETVKAAILALQQPGLADKVPESPYAEDLMDIVRTLVCAADNFADMTPERRANYPSPISNGSPLMQAARRACVERGFTEGGLTQGLALVAAPSPQEKP